MTKPEGRILLNNAPVRLKAHPKRGQAPLCEAPSGPFRQRCLTPFRTDSVRPHQGDKLRSAKDQQLAPERLRERLSTVDERRFDGHSGAREEVRRQRPTKRLATTRGGRT